jgi:hypothetical protein
MVAVDGPVNLLTWDPMCTVYALYVQSFVCKSTGTEAAKVAIAAAGANKHITDLLDQLQEVYEVGTGDLDNDKNADLRCDAQLEGDQWRANGYKRASATLLRMGRCIGDIVLE